MTDFTKRFATFSNSELLRIIDSPNDYQPLAIVAAQTIIASRQLSDDDIEIAKAELAALVQEKEAKTKNLENKVKNIGASVLAIVNPIQTETPSSDKIIKIISIVFSGLFLFQLYKELGMISFMFTDSEAKWGSSMLLYFLPLLIVPIATVLFFKRKKLGWTLLAIFLTYSAVNSIGLFILTLNREPSALDAIFPQTSPIIQMLILLFFGGTLWTICREHIREIYFVDKKYLTTTIGVIAIITALTTYVLT
ncbi:hypothetical protein D3C72_616720 [compost metagenome]